MFQKKDPTGMLPSEMVAYIEELHTELKMIEGNVASLSRADHFTGTRQGDPIEYETEQELIDGLDLGEVIHVQRFKHLGETFKVKISPTRIDDCDTRIEAQHVAMLHGH